MTDQPLLDRSLPAGESLTPAQLRVLDELFGAGQPRPPIEAGLAAALRSDLEARLAPAVALLPGKLQLFVGKSALERVLGCEAHHLAEEADGFFWTAQSAKGAVAHKAIELHVGHRRAVPPADLVDQALERLESDGRMSDFLTGVGEAELADLRVTATEHVQIFLDSVPPLKAEWRPRLEFKLEAQLCAERIVLSGRPDLALGRITGDRAQVLIVDFKTGRPWGNHADDLRLYALLHLLRFGVPPWRVASFYLSSGEWRAEDVTAELLEVAVRRVADGALRLAELKAGREPVLTPGRTCSFCSLRQACPGAVQWRDERESLGLDDY